MTRACFALLLAGALAAGCSSSHGPGDVDAGIVFDATPPDGGGPPPPPTDGGGPDDTGVMPPPPPPEPFCGDGMLDPMEQCDDGNTEAGDGCDADCHRESFCGNDMVDMGEVCDDGNNRSGDGCRSDCRSDETCGNGMRDVVVGEQCDDGNTEDGDGCSADCRTLESCGDGTVDAGEQCDDGNTDRFDGCAPDCTFEQTQVVNFLELGDRSVGCDYSGDGRPDNTLARALGPAVGLLNSMALEPAIMDGDVILLMHFMGLDDPTGANDDSLTLAWLQGADTDGNAGNNFSGSAELTYGDGAFDADGNPLTSFESALMSRRLSGGPEDISLPIGFLPLDLKGGRITGVTSSSGGRVSTIDEGILCGAVPLATFTFLPNFLDMFAGPAPACDGSGADTNLGDVIVGGTPSGFIFPLRGVQPDVDIDGDGLESFEVQDTGPAGCQPVIVACIDGDGTRIEGHDCPTDSRFADGHSTGLNFTSVSAVLVAP